MTRGRSAFTAVVVTISLAIALSGCTAASTGVTQEQAIAAGASPLAQLEVPASSIPAKYYDQRVAWHPCNGDECGTIAVPENWADLGGPSISLALIEHKATVTPIGTLVVDPGGPGESGVTWVGRDFAAVVDPSVAARYNVVGFDPRGVGASTAVSCLTPQQLDQYIFAPTVGLVGSDDWIADQLHRASVMAAGCKNDSGVLLANLDTVSVAHDLDVIRSSLGEEKLDYFGASWGTYLGTVYAGLYPTKTGRFVLDGAFDPWSDAARDGTTQAIAFEDDLDAYVAACLSESRRAVGAAQCPFSGDSPKAEHAIRDLLVSTDEYPIVVTAGLNIDGALLSKAIIQALYSPKYWPLLTDMFIQLRKGVTTDAMRLIGARYGLDVNGVPVDNFEVAFLAARCIEAGSRYDIARDDDRYQLLTQKAPVLGPWLGYGDLTCSSWPYEPPPFPVPVHAPTASQMLVLGTTGDPATPYKEAQDLAMQLATAHLVTFHGEGHTAYDKGNACINRVIDKYLLDGAVPKSDPDCH